MIREELYGGLFRRNPVLVLALGLCPSLAVCTDLRNAVGMGCAVLAVLVCGNVAVSLLRKLAPGNSRTLCHIVTIAALVTIAQFFYDAFFPALGRRLGMYVPLIAINCIILARAEVFASGNRVYKSFVDGVIMGLLFLASLCAVAVAREILGSNTVWGVGCIPGYRPMPVFVLAPGGFFILAAFVLLVNYLRRRKEGA